jgi:hypothetical protein
MKVLCIDAESRPDCPPCDLVEGEIYTVIDTMHLCKNKYGHVESHTVYILLEQSSDYCYGVERFVPCSGADETELVTEAFEEKYCVPV